MKSYVSGFLVTFRCLPFTYSAPAILASLSFLQKARYSLSQGLTTSVFLHSQEDIAVLEGSCSQGFVPFTSQSRSFTYLYCSPGTFVLQFLYLGPWAEVFLKCFWWGCLMFGDIFTLQAYFSPADSVFPFWALPPHLSFPPLPRVHKTAGAFWSELPQQSKDPHVCVDPLNPWLLYCTERERDENMEKQAKSPEELVWEVLVVPKRRECEEW